jgi:hypothetical protein
MGVDSTTDEQKTAVSTPMNVIWRCLPRFTLVSQGAINADLCWDFATPRIAAACFTLFYRHRRPFLTIGITIRLTSRITVLAKGGTFF